MWEKCLSQKKTTSIERVFYLTKLLYLVNVTVSLDAESHEKLC